MDKVLVIFDKLCVTRSPAENSRSNLENLWKGMRIAALLFAQSFLLITANSIILIYSIWYFFEGGVILVHIPSGKFQMELLIGDGGSECLFVDVS